MNNKKCTTCRGFIKKTCICNRCINMYRDKFGRCDCNIYSWLEIGKYAIRYEHDSTGLYKCMSYTKDWIKELKNGN